MSSGPLCYFEVANWSEFQHYKDRRPQWIKLYNALQDNYQFAALPDAAKGQLMGIWLLASRLGNRIPWDVSWLAAKIHATTPIDLDLLLSSGFIKKINAGANPEHPASDLFQERTVPASLERETETEREGEQDSSRALTGLEPPVAVWIPVVGVKPADEKNPLLKRLDLPKEKQIWHMGVLEAEVTEWATVYPGVNIDAALLRARDWCVNNPAKRKTPRGIGKFVSTWLAREQDRGQTPGGRQPSVAGGHSAADRVRRHRTTGGG